MSSQQFRTAECLLLLVAVALSLSGLSTITLGDNATSRLATAYALVHDGTFYIDRPPAEAPNPFEINTVDKVYVYDRVLSSKPPILPLIMTAQYWVLHHVGGMSLERKEDIKPIAQILTATLFVSSYVVTLLFFSALLRLFGVAPTVHLYFLAALAFGSQLAGYSAQINNHVPGAAALLAAIYFCLRILKSSDTPRPLHFLLFGISGALTHTFELPMTIFIAFCGIALLLRFPKQTLLFGGLGMAPILVLHFGVLWATTGLPLPVQLRKDLYLFEGSRWRTPVGVEALHEPKLLYLFHMTLGRHGVFTLFPVLLLGLWSLLRALVLPVASRGFTLAGGAGLLVLTAYYVQSTNNYGGMAYGFRWYIAAMPLLLVIAAVHIPQPRSYALRGLLFCLLAVSMYSAWECFQAPWSYEQEWTSRLIFGPANL